MALEIINGSIYCKDFNCFNFGNCINADNTCHFFQHCPKIYHTGLCGVCSLGSFCPSAMFKEVKDNGKLRKSNNKR